MTIAFYSDFYRSFVQGTTPENLRFASEMEMNNASNANCKSKIYRTKTQLYHKVPTFTFPNVNRLTLLVQSSRMDP